MNRPVTLNDTLTVANAIIRDKTTDRRRTDIIARLQKYKKLYEESIKKVTSVLTELEANEPRAPPPVRLTHTISRPTLKMVQITPKFELPATLVDNFEQVVTDGQLYYVGDAGHFAMRLIGQLFHGNIGIISDDKRFPRTTACKFADCKKQDCMFYHDPVIFGGNNRRNYTNAGSIYTPAKAPRSGRHFGSIDNIEDDAASLTRESVSYIKDRAFHELLCAMVAANYLDGKR